MPPISFNVAPGQMITGVLDAFDVGVDATRILSSLMASLPRTMMTTAFERQSRLPTTLRPYVGRFTKVIDPAVAPYGTCKLTARAVLVFHTSGASSYNFVTTVEIGLGASEATYDYFQTTFGNLPRSVTARTRIDSVVDQVMTFLDDQVPTYNSAIFARFLGVQLGVVD